MAQPDDRDRFVASLTGIAGRMSVRRAVELAAVGLIAAGLCAAVLEIAWSVAGLHGAWATALAAVVLAGPAALAVGPARRRLRLARAEAALVVAECAAAGLIGLWAVSAGWHAGVGKALMAGGLLAAGGGAGLAWGLVRGPRLREAAVLLDARCGLAERVATAQELARSDQPADAAGRCVLRQATAALAKLTPDQTPLWRRTRATAGVAALVVLLCGALTALPTLRLEEQLADKLGAMTPEAREALQEALRAAKTQAGEKSPQGQLLDRAVVAVEVKDKEELRDVLQKLRDLGVPLRKIVDPGVVAKAIASAAGEGGGEAASGGQGAETQPTPPFAASRPSVPDPGPGPAVYVYDPQYAKALAKRPTTGPAAGPGPKQGLVRLDESWRRAGARARESLSAGKVPPEYRQLVRDFFATDRH